MASRTLLQLCCCLGALGLLLTLVGCSNFGPACDTSNDSNPAELYVGGTVVNGVYRTSPWTGPLLEFRGGQRYALAHKLGCAPAMIHVWEAFSEQGTTAGSISQCAGNMCVVQTVDDKSIIIKNDTCSDYFVLVVASDPICGDAAVTDAQAEDASND